MLSAERNKPTVHLQKEWGTYATKRAGLGFKTPLMTPRKPDVCKTEKDGVTHYHLRTQGVFARSVFVEVVW